MDNTKKIILEALDYLKNDFYLICDLPPNSFSLSSKKSAPIGAHMRHIYEFIEILNHNLESQLVNYEKRNRNTKVEQDSLFCKNCFAQEIVQLKNNILQYNLDTPIKIEEQILPESDPILGHSTLAREVIFLIDHTIHHFAFIKFITDEHNIRVSENFGMAFSTIKYNESEKNKKFA